MLMVAAWLLVVIMDLNHHT